MEENQQTSQKMQRVYTNMAGIRNMWGIVYGPNSDAMVIKRMSSMEKSILLILMRITW